MKVITVSDFFSTNIHSEFQQIKTIEIDDKPFAEGGFGIVYDCITINGKKSPIPQVIKIFKEDENFKQDHNFQTVRTLQKKLNKENKLLLSSKKSNITEEYPSLKGIPQFSFIGILNGKKVRGFSSTNLKKLGFEEFIDILEKPILNNKYMRISIDKKLLIAFHLVSGFKMLQKIFFIHADLKPEAIFINTTTNECAIIDFDSGAITEHINDEPNTWGTKNDWLAPEIWEQLKQSNSTGLQKIKVNLLSDIWSVMVGIHYILTTAHPLFYLKELSPRVINQYFAKYQWPNIDENESYFNSANRTIYKPIKNWLENKLQKPIYDEFVKTINYGYNNPLKRTTYNEWEKVLKSIQSPPDIINFSTNKTTIIKGVPIILEWDVKNAYKVEINNEIGVVNSKGKKEVYLNDNTEFILTAIGYFGTSTKKIQISVFPTPVLKTLFVPAPDFSQKINLNIKTPKFNYSPNGLDKVDFSINQYKKEIKIDNFTNNPIIPSEEIKKIKKELNQINFWNKISLIYEKIKKRIS